jgi:hypothetical protein
MPEMVSGMLSMHPLGFSDRSSELQARISEVKKASTIDFFTFIMISPYPPECAFFLIAILAVVDDGG